MIDLISLNKKINEILTYSCNKLIKLFDSKVLPEIRARIIKILAKSQLPQYEDLIIDFFNKNTHLEDAIIAVANINKEKAIDALIEKVKLKTLENRDIITEQLGNYKNNPKVLETLKELLKDEDRHVRFQAINSLFSFGGKSAALALCDVIFDPDEWISMTALKALCKLKEHETIPHLVEQFKRDTDLRRKAQMVSFLSAFRSVTLVSIFDEGLKGKDARLKANSIEAIAELELPEREIKQRILPFLQDPNNRIRANAILALAKSEPDLVRQDIIKMVESNDVQLRRSAAFILGKISPEKNLELAEKLISDASADVRKRMVLSLNTFPKDFVQKQLEKTVSDPNKWIRKYSIEQAANFPNFPKPLILRQLKIETATPNIIACMKFFTTHLDEEAIKIIKARLKDKNSDIVCQAIKTISSIFGLKGVQAIASQINYKDPKILNEFVVNHFSLGGYDIFPTILDKALQIKNNFENPILDSIESCIEILILKNQMPKPLLNEIIKFIETERENNLKSNPKPEKIISDEQTEATSVVINQNQESQLVSFQKDELVKDVDKEQLIEEAQNVPTIKQPQELIKAIKFFNLGKYSKAKPLLIEITNNYPDITKAKFYLAVIYYEEKEYEKAKKYISYVLEKEPGNKKALLLQVKILKQLREWDEIIAILESNLPKFANDEDEIKIKKELGTAYIFCQKFEKARNLLEKVYLNDNSDYNLNYHLAMTYFHLNELDKAEAILKELIQKLPQKHKLQFMVGSLNEKIKSLKLPAQNAMSKKENTSEIQINQKENFIEIQEILNLDNIKTVTEKTTIDSTQILEDMSSSHTKQSKIEIIKTSELTKSIEDEQFTPTQKLEDKQNDIQINALVGELVSSKTLSSDEISKEFSNLEKEKEKENKLIQLTKVDEKILKDSIKDKVQELENIIKTTTSTQNLTKIIQQNEYEHRDEHKEIVQKETFTLKDFKGIQGNIEKSQNNELEQITLVPLSDVFKELEKSSNKEKEKINTSKTSSQQQSITKINSLFNKENPTDKDKSQNKDDQDNSLDDIFKLPSI